MGQLVLGLRSLLVRITIFVVMAALLAWALGGTLFPRPEVAARPGATFADAEWRWEVLVGGRDPGMTWRLVRAADRRAVAIQEGAILDAARLVVTTDALVTAYRDGAGWRLIWFDAAGTATRSITGLDRLAVEWQLARLEQGLPIEAESAIRNKRPHADDPIQKETLPRVP